MTRAWNQVGEDPGKKGTKRGFRTVMRLAWQLPARPGVAKAEAVAAAEAAKEFAATLQMAPAPAGAPAVLLTLEPSERKMMLV